MDTTKYPTWLPESVKNKCIPVATNKGMPSEFTEVLDRLLTDRRMKQVYKALQKKCVKEGGELGNHILGVMVKTFDVKSYPDFPISKYKDKLKSISKKTQSIAEDLKEINKGGIILPAHLEDPSSFLLKFYGDKHESSPNNSFIKAHKDYLRVLKERVGGVRNSDIDLINALKALSEYFEKQSHVDPYISWKEEFLGKPPKKLLKKTKNKYQKPILLQKNALIRILGAYIFSIYGTPLHNTVATLTNVALYLRKDDCVDEGHVKKTLGEYLTDELKQHLKERCE